jgi:hypothetical protein
MTEILRNNQGRRKKVKLTTYRVTSEMAAMDEIGINLALSRLNLTTSSTPCTLTGKDLKV